MKIHASDKLNVESNPALTGFCKAAGHARPGQMQMNAK